MNKEGDYGIPVPVYVEDVSTKVVKIIQSYTGVVDKMVWRKYQHCFLAIVMKILFLSLSRIDDLNKRGIYSDLLRCFHRKGHDIYAAFPYERKYKLHTSLKNEERFHALGINSS